MRVIKPINSTIITRPFRFLKKNYLAINGIIFIDNNNNYKLKSEQDLWKQFSDVCLKEFQTSVLEMGIPRKYPEFLVFGYGYGKYSKHNVCAVSVKLNNVYKSLLVFGDRYWDGDNISDPIPFDKIPINWQNSYGGEGYEFNPFGKGKNEVLINGVKTLQLPNIEKAGNLIRKKNDSVKPEIFTPMFVDYPNKNMLMGTYDDKWREEDFPGFAKDIDWSYFNQAFPDQRLHSLNANDEIVYSNLNPEYQELINYVPDIRLKAFLKPKGKGFLDPIQLKLTSYWGFPHDNTAFLIYQNSIETISDDDSDFSDIILAIDYKDDCRPKSHYEEIYRERTSFKIKPSSILYDGSLVSKELLPEGLKFPLSDLLLKPLKKAVKDIDVNQKKLDESENKLNNQFKSSKGDYKNQQTEIVNEQLKLLGGLVNSPTDTSTLSNTKKLLEKGYYELDDFDKNDDLISSFDKSMIEQKREEKKIRKQLDLKIKDIEDKFKDVDSSPELEEMKARHNERSKIKYEHKVLYANTSGNEHTNYINESYDKLNDKFLEVCKKPSFDFESKINAQNAKLASFSLTIDKDDKNTFIVKDETISGVNFENSIVQNVIYEKLYFKGVTFDGVTFNGVQFNNCRFDDVVFKNCQIDKVEFNSSDLSLVKFSSLSFLTLNSFVNCNLESCEFVNVISGRIFFRNISFKSTNFEYIGFNRCMFDSVKFFDCKFLQTGIMQGRFNNISFINCKNIESLAIAFKVIKNIEFINCKVKYGTITLNSTVHNLKIHNCHFKHSGFRDNVYNNVEIIDSDMSNNDFSSSEFNNLYATNTYFVESIFDKTFFNQCKFNNCDFRLSNLKSSIFETSALNRVSFYSAELSMVNISSDTVLSECNTELANFVPKL